MSGPRGMVGSRVPLPTGLPSWLSGAMMTDRDYLEACVSLAREALAAGDEPFGSILVSDEGEQLVADRNRVAGGDQTQHPEFAIARWAAQFLSPDQRRRATVYTSGEHCAMCSAAHAWVGLGRIVYASSTQQLVSWHAEWGIAPGPVAPLPITAVAPGIDVAGPDPELSLIVKDLHRQLHGIPAP